MYYEKRNFDKKQRILRRYLCCLKCFEELLPGDRFKVPSNKLQKKTLPEKKRGFFWRELKTMELLEDNEIPFVKIPLNPDAFVDFQEFK